MALILRILIALSTFVYTCAECINACSNHGTCGAFDMCTCYKNWMGNDCSQRICQFGVAHSDSAKGDLNADGIVSKVDKTVVIGSQMYPWGTTEAFPSLADDSAHSYMECSNKGSCDRTSGVCVCYEGYEGSACQRSTCPSSAAGVCSGNGLCRTAEQIADLDGNNVYLLWDKKSAMGCVCDPGYTGIDCSQKICKYGFDPLYSDHPNTVRYTNITYSIYTTASATLDGNYSLMITDKLGKTWNTDPIKQNANCDDVTTVIENIPNKAFPSGSVLCYKWNTDQIVNTELNPIHDAGLFYQVMFTLAFPGNAGYLPELRINKYNDGTRPTLTAANGTTTVTPYWHIYANGFIGEDYDVVPDLCENVMITIDVAGNIISDSTDAATVKLLKKCLGDADGNPAANEISDVENWQPGTIDNPHLIKLVDATQDKLIDESDDLDPDAYDYPKTQLCSSASKSYINSNYPAGWCKNINPPGFYAAIYYNTSNFVILNRAGLPYKLSTGKTPKFHVYTTKGYLQKISDFTAYSYNKAIQTLPSQRSKFYHSNVMLYGNMTGIITNYTARPDIACSATQKTDCLSKGDFVTFLNPSAANNPVYLNLYTIKRVGVDPKVAATGKDLQSLHTITLDYGVNAKYYDDSTAGILANIYKFTPPVNQYKYVDQCATRGLCDTTSGTCNCFAGYTTDNCARQNALAQ